MYYVCYVADNGEFFETIYGEDDILSRVRRIRRDHHIGLDRIHVFKAEDELKIEQGD